MQIVGHALSRLNILFTCRMRPEKVFSLWKGWVTLWHKLAFHVEVSLCSRVQSNCDARFFVARLFLKKDLGAGLENETWDPGPAFSIHCGTWHRVTAIFILMMIIQMTGAFLIWSLIVMSASMPFWDKTLMLYANYAVSLTLQCRRLQIKYLISPCITSMQQRIVTMHLNYGQGHCNTCTFQRILEIPH